MSDVDDIFDKIDEKFNEHQRNYHGDLEAGEGTELIEEHRQMVTNTRSSNKMMQRMIVAIEGEPVKNMSGQVTGYKGGLVNQVESIDKRTKTGTFSPTRGQKVTFWIGASGVVTALTYLVIAVIQATS
jgi:hypothetical protein